MPELITEAEATELLQVSRWSVIERRRRGTMPPVHHCPTCGRSTVLYRREDILKLKAERDGRRST